MLLTETKDPIRLNQVECHQAEDLVSRRWKWHGDYTLSPQTRRNIGTTLERMIGNRWFATICANSGKRFCSVKIELKIENQEERR